MQNDLNKIREKIREIEEKSADGDYIYRGEPEHHAQESSLIYHQGKAKAEQIIEFMTDYLIALFFACDGSHDKPGRVVLLKKTDAIANQIRLDQNPLRQC